jgi:hypothetical protein
MVACWIVDDMSLWRNARRLFSLPVTKSAKMVGFALLAGCLGSFLLDGLAFRTLWYSRFLEPNSAAGRFELVLARERDAQTRYGANLIVAFGDSRLGITPKVCNDLEPETGYFFRSAGVPGSLVLHAPRSRPVRPALSRDPPDGQ